LWLVVEAHTSKTKPNSSFKQLKKSAGVAQLSLAEDR
jgi:hypothetical protein